MQSKTITKITLIVNRPFSFKHLLFYHLRMWRGNAFGHVRLCVFVCLSCSGSNV